MSTYSCNTTHHLHDVNWHYKISEVKKVLNAHSRPGGDGKAQICCVTVEVEEPQLFCLTKDRDFDAFRLASVTTSLLVYSP